MVSVLSMPRTNFQMRWSDGTVSGGTNIQIENATSARLPGDMLNDFEITHSFGNLESLEVHDSDLWTNGYISFIASPKLSAITFDKGLPNLRNGETTFEGCTALSDVELNAPNLRYAESMFDMGTKNNAWTGALLPKINYFYEHSSPVTATANHVHMFKGLTGAVDYDAATATYPDWF